MTDQLVRPTIPIAYVADIVARCRATPRAIAGALAAGDIPARALASRRMRVSIVQLERFHAALGRAGDDEVFGFFARPVPRGSFATLLALLVDCDDVRAMLDAAARFYRLFDRHAYFAFELDRRRATLHLVTRDAEQARSIFFVHTMLLAPWRTAAWLVDRPIPLDEVVLPARFRPFRRETRYLFGREPTFAAGAPRIAFAAELASLAVVRRRSDADAHARASLRAIMLAPPAPTLHDELRGVLAAAQPFADLGVADAARRLGRSRASLARELARHGSTFQDIKDELRRDRAIALLAETSLDFAEIAERLGYSAASAFQRAFRQWTGVAPGALRSVTASPRAARAPRSSSRAAATTRAAGRGPSRRSRRARRRGSPPPSRGRR